MKLQGYIASVEEAIDSKTGEQRTWVSPEGSTYEFFKAHLILIQHDAHGEEVKETMCAEFCRTRSENQIPPYRDYIRTEGSLLELYVSCKEREHNGNHYNTLKLINARAYAT